MVAGQSFLCSVLFLRLTACYFVLFVLLNKCTTSYLRDFKGVPASRGDFSRDRWKILSISDILFKDRNFAIIAVKDIRIVE